ncbi:hypothetical protein DMN91_005841 [Ooceraea biroi]|uniref:Uncharacterized protein n=1 Tax=Ooceraea biroi TaxID=2015173 RepID=A0A3L8DNT7_OOCBI|nr:golgin subfamily A member 6-like protein 7 [Ooceraea biroi]RLU21468.1 hypothetical protein DMN91_005841 [Ooceraea biroi]
MDHQDMASIQNVNVSDVSDDTDSSASFVIIDEDSADEVDASLLTSYIQQKSTLSDFKEIILLKEQEENLDNQSDQLLKEKELLEEEKTSLKQEKEMLEEQSDQLLKEMKLLEKDKNSLKQEKEMLDEQSDQLLMEKKLLKEETFSLQLEKQICDMRHQLLEEKKLIEKERASLKQEKYMFYKQYEKLQMKKKLLEKKTINLKQEKEMLDKQSNQLLKEKKLLEEENIRLKEERHMRDMQRSEELYSSCERLSNAYKKHLTGGNQKLQKRCEQLLDEKRSIEKQLIDERKQHEDAKKRIVHKDDTICALEEVVSVLKDELTFINKTRSPLWPF